MPIVQNTTQLLIRIMNKFYFLSPVNENLTKWILMLIRAIHNTMALLVTKNKSLIYTYKMKPATLFQR